MHPSTRHRPRGLRIGVVLGDTLIAEQILEHGTFSIGRKASSTVQLPMPGLPARWELLTIDGRGLRLRLMPAMEVRLADGSNVRTRAELGGDAAGQGPLEIALPADARGKVTLGEIKVMFHEVAIAPKAPRPALPPELRSTLADRIDRRVLAFAAASLALHVGVMAAARLNDPPADLTRAEQVMADYQQETVIDADQLPPLPEPEPTAKPPEPGVAAQQPAPVPDRPSTVRHDPRPARPGPATVDDPAADATRVADALFSSDDGGLVAGDAARRRPSGDLAGQLEELRREHASASIGGDSDHELPHAPGPRLGTTDGPPGPDVPGQVTHVDPPPSHEPDGGRIIITPHPKPPPGEPSIDGIIAKIKSTYMTGLVRCYKRSMAGQGTLAGKVVLAFTVTERGATSDAGATGVDSGFEQCVDSLMSNWRFTPIVDDDGDPTDLDVKVTLQLRPD